MLKQGFVLAATLLALTGCTFCRENRAVCVAAGAGLIGGSIMASSGGRGSEVRGYAPSICSSKPESCR